MGPNHTERVADGLDVVEPGRRGYRQLLNSTDGRPLAPAPAPAWPSSAVVGLVALAVLALAAIGAGLADAAGAGQLARALQVVATVATAVVCVATLALGGIFGRKGARR